MPKKEITITVHLSFNGNCREAMRFYRKCLGGELSFQTAGKSPLSARLPFQMKKKIVHAELRHRDFLLMGSDLVADEGLHGGNTISLALQCASEAATRSIYKNLSQGGTATQPLAFNAFGMLLGSVTDKYETRWIVSYSKK
jgi:PhnB protein